MKTFVCKSKGCGQKIGFGRGGVRPHYSKEHDANTFDCPHCGAEYKEVSRATDDAGEKLQEYELISS